jgi:hypothetical protein
VTDGAVRPPTVSTTRKSLNRWLSVAGAGL